MLKVGTTKIFGLPNFKKYSKELGSKAVPLLHFFFVCESVVSYTAFDQHEISSLILSEKKKKKKKKKKSEVVCYSFDWALRVNKDSR